MLVVWSALRLRQGASHGPLLDRSLGEVPRRWTGKVCRWSEWTSPDLLAQVGETDRAARQCRDLQHLLFVILSK